MGSSNGIRTVPDRMGCCIRCLSDCQAAVAVDCIYKKNRKEFQCMEILSGFFYITIQINARSEFSDR